MFSNRISRRSGRSWHTKVVRIRWQVLSILNIMAMLISSVGFGPQPVNARFDQSSNLETVINSPQQQIAAPENDLFVNAEIIYEIPHHISIDLTDATSGEQLLTAPCGGGTGGNNVWYQFTPPTDVQVSLDSTGSDDGIIAVLWSGLDLPEPNATGLICTNATNPTGSYSIYGGETYWLEIRQTIVEAEGYQATIALSPEIYIGEENLPVMQGLKATYSDGVNPDVVQYGQGLSYDWVDGTPVDGINSDNFQATFHGYISIPEDNEITFYLTAEGGANLWIDGIPVIERYGDLTVNEQVTTYLQGGLNYEILVDFNEVGGDSSINLEWSSSTISRQAIPLGDLSYINLDDILINLEFTSLGLGLWNTLEFDPLIGENGYYDSTPLYIMFDQPGWVIERTPTIEDNWFNLGESWDGFYVYISSYSPSNSIIRFRISDYVLSNTQTVETSFREFQGFYTEYYDGEGFLSEPYGYEISEAYFTFNVSYTSSPVSHNNEPFSAKWLSRYTPSADSSFTFYVQNNDPVRLWVDDQLIIDDWNSHALTWQQGSINLTAGVTYDLRIESYAAIDPTSYLRIEWESGYFSREILSTQNLTYIDFSGTTVVSDTDIITPDGIDTAEIQIELKNGYDQYILGYPIEINVSGTGNLINGVPITDADWIQLTNSSLDEGYTFELTSTEPGIKNILYRVGNYILPVTTQVTTQNPIENLTAVYFNNVTLTPPSFSTENVTVIDYNWGGGHPLEGMPDDQFSARWYGKIQANEITEAEVITFIGTSDDGMRLWIDGQLVIDSWITQSATEHIGLFIMEPDTTYDFVLEYFEEVGDAVIKLEMQSPSIPRRLVTGSDFVTVNLQEIQTDINFSKESAVSDGEDFVTVEIDVQDGLGSPISDDVYVNLSGSQVYVNGVSVSDTEWVLIPETNIPGTYQFELSSTYYGEKGIQIKLGNFPLDRIGTYQFTLADMNLGLKGEYYSNINLEEPAFTIIENQIIHYDYGYDGPVAGMPPDFYSIRWSGYIKADYSETYTFHTYSDDGVRLWVDGNLLVDSWIVQGATYYSGNFEMVAGQYYEIVVEYFENNGGALVSLEWESSSLPREIVPLDHLFMTAIPEYQINLTVTPQIVEADGFQTAQMNLTVMDENNLPVEEGVSIRINGENVFFGGSYVSQEDWILLSPTATPGVYTGNISSITTGEKTIEVKIGEYIQDTQVSVEFVRSDVGLGLRGEYFESTDFTSPVCEVDYTDEINYLTISSWEIPVNSACSDVESVRWMSRLTPEYTETYQFYTSDSRMNIWVNGIQKETSADYLTIDLVAGQPVPVVIEISNLTSPDPYDITLEWSSAQVTREIIPGNNFSYVNHGQSFASLSMNTIKIQDEETTQITVEAKRDDGGILNGFPVFIRVSGTDNYVNGVLIPNGEWYEIGFTDDNGLIQADLYTTELGEKIVEVSIDRMLLLPNLLFTAEEYQIQILLEGETAAPNTETGKTGSAVNIYQNDPTLVRFRVVNSTYQLLDTASGTIELTSSDASAQMPATVQIVNGVGQAYITWGELGLQTITTSTLSTFITSPGSTALEVTDSLIVGSGETVYMDSVRTYLTSDLTPGNMTMNVNNAQGFYPGHKVLLLKMTGVNAGKFETSQISAVNGNQIELYSPVAQSYTTVLEKTVMLLVPRIIHLTVQNGGVLTAHNWNGNTGGVLYLDINDIVVESGATVHVNARGYDQHTGPGAGTGYTGGGYGGEGASNYYPTTNGKPYGDPTLPFLLGSGGGDPGFTSGGKGAGIIRILATTIITNGTISANGGQAGAFYAQTGGGGSGGSLWLSADSFSGVGSILATGGIGGEGIWSYRGYGGGGGRIAIDVETNDFTGNVQAFGGYGASYGGAGSIYWSNENKLVINNNNYNSGYFVSGLVGGDYEFDTVELINKGSLFVKGINSSINLGGNGIIADGTTRFTSEGLILKNGLLNVSGYSLDVKGQLSGVTSLTVGENQTVDLYAYTPIYSGPFNIDTVLVEANGTVKLHSYDNQDSDYTNDLLFDLQTQNLTVETGGKITLDGYGYLHTADIGRGPGGGLGSSVTGSYGVGASYGGKGGASFSGELAADPYGNAQQPTQFGSAGGQGGGSIGGDGGGALKLTVSDTLTLNGMITASGKNAGINGGGGSGGSIWIDATTMLGSGILFAEGGTSTGSGAGGGGRIAIWADTLGSGLQGSVYGGNGMNKGDSGSLYLDQLTYQQSSITVNTIEDVIANGSDQILITLHVVDLVGNPIQNQEVEISIVSGETLIVNGTNNLSTNTYLAVGTTDNNGDIQVGLAANLIGEREIIARTRGIPFGNSVTVNFINGPVSLSASTITATTTALADGETSADIQVTLRDDFNHLIPDYPFTITTSGSAILEPLDGNLTTDANGYAAASITNTIAEDVLIRALVDGEFLENTATVQFRGADMALEITPQALVNGGYSSTAATAGYPITVDVTVWNAGVVQTDGVGLDVMLPEEFIYADGPTYCAYDAVNSVLHCALPETYEPNGGTTIPLIFNVQPDAIGNVSTTFTLVTPNLEENLANQTVLLTTEINNPTGQISIIREADVFGILQGQTKTETIIIKNTGTAAIENLGFSYEDLPSWAAFYAPPAVDNLAPNEEIPVTVTYSTAADETTSLSTWTLTVTADGIGSTVKPVDVEVVPAGLTQRNLTIELLDILENPIASNSTVILTPQTYITSELPDGTPINYQPVFAQDTNQNGSVTYTNLEPGTYTYEVFSDGYEYLSGVVSVQPGLLDQVHQIHMTSMGILYFFEVIEIADGISIRYEIHLTAEFIDGRPFTIVPAWCTADIGCTWTNEGGVGSGVIYDATEYTHGGGGSSYSGYSRPPYVEYRHSLMRLSQEAMLSWQAFNAILGLQNANPTPIYDLSIDLNFAYPDGSDHTNEFIVESQSPAIPTTLDPGGIVRNNWMIIPTGAGITDPNGQIFIVTAQISYTQNGEAQSFTTLPQRITVYPTPELKVTYTLPPSDDFCDLFDLNVEIENNGFGPAKNLTLTSGQPWTESNEENPVQFTLETASLEGSPILPVFQMNFGDLQPGESKQGFWRISASRPVQFISFSGEVEATSPLAETLNPITELVTQLSPGACLNYQVLLEATRDTNCDNCSPIQGTQGNVGGPINTLTGAHDYASLDLSIQTAYGPIEVERWYSSAAVDEFSAPYSAGWTHSLDKSLEISQDVVWLNLRSTNEYKFWVVNDGSGGPMGEASYVAYPGFFADLSYSAITQQYTLLDQNKNVLTFNYQGKILSEVNEQGVGIHYLYNETTGNLTRVENQDGSRFLAFTYTPDGKLEQVNDHTNRGISYQYDPVSGNLTGFTDAENKTWVYQYDPVFTNHLTVVNDPAGNVVERTVYDDLGRAIRQYDGLDNLIVALDFTLPNHTVIEDVFGNQAVHHYNSANTLVSSENAFSQTQGKTYNNEYRPLVISDPAGIETQLTWSDDGEKLTSILDGLAQQTVLDYDLEGNLSLLRDALGNESTFNYSGSLLAANTDALGNTTNYTYTTAADAPQPIGLLKSITDALGFTTTYGYDANGQLTSTTNPLGITTTYHYDALGRMIAQTTPDGLSYWNCYDDLGRVIRTVENASGDGSTPQTDPCDSTNYVPSSDPKYDRLSERVYDSAGNLIAAINNQGQITRTYYDSANRPVATVRYLSNWDIANPALPSLELRTATQNLVTETVYDAAGRMIATIGLDGRINRTYYDELGRAAYSVQNLVGQDVQAAAPPPASIRTIDQNRLSQNLYDERGNLIATVDLVPGCEVSSTTGPDGELIYTASADCLVTRLYYDALNRVTATVVNLSGQPITDESIPNRNPADNEFNLRSDSVYDAVGNLIASIDPVGRISRTYYDALQRAVFSVENLTNWPIETNSPPPANQRTHQENITTQMIYDEAGNMIASIDPVGNLSRTWYDELNRPVQSVTNLHDPARPDATVAELLALTAPPAYDQQHPDWNLPSATPIYDAYGRSIGSTDPLGHINRTYYDILQRPLQSVQNLTGQGVEVNSMPSYDENHPDQNVPGSQIVYDADGRQIAAINPVGTITRNYYDELGRAWLTVQNLTGQTIEAETPPSFDPNTADENIRSETIYNAAGQVIANKDTYGKISRVYFDELNRPVVQVQNLVGQDVYVDNPPVYDPQNPEENIRTETVYDRYGRTIATRSPNGTIQRNYYDTLGRVVITITNLQGQDVLVDTPPTYDPLNPNANIPHYMNYDLASNLISRTDAEGVTTRYEYDTLNRLTAVIENERPGLPADHQTNLRTEYTYDVLGNRLTIRNAQATLNNTQDVTSFGYDAVGRQVSETDPLGNTWSQTYNILNQRATATDANGDTILYIYDAIGRLITIDYPEPQSDVQFGYDINSRRETMTDGLGTTAWDYDSLGRVETITDPNNQQIGYGYDALGNRTRLTYPDAKQVTYGYDALYRLTEVLDWNNQTTTYAYDVSSRLLETSLPNGVLSNYQYDDLGRLTNLSHTRTDQTISTFTYTYDTVGNRTAVQETQLVPGGNPPYVTVTVKNTNEIPQAGLRVYAYDNNTSTGYNSLTDENGNAQLVLPFGDYHFRVMVNDTQFWSDTVNHCHVEGCHYAEITVTEPVQVLVQDNLGDPVSGEIVRAYQNGVDSGYFATTDQDGYGSFTLPTGDYDFRVLYNYAVYWSGETCTVPGCVSSTVTVALPITVTVVDTEGELVEGARVYVYNGETNTGLSGLTDVNGEVDLSVSDGDYRFRVKYNDVFFWSDTVNHCTIPGCNNVQVTVSHPVTISVTDSDGLAQENAAVHVYQGETDTGISGTTDVNGEIDFTLMAGDYRFLVDPAPSGGVFWSGASNSCTIPGCTHVGVEINAPVTVSVLDAGGSALSGIVVNVYDGETDTGYQDTTESNGNAEFALADGNYRFRAEINGIVYWSDTGNHSPEGDTCAVPSCTLVSIQESTQLPTPTPVPTSTGANIAPENGLNHVRASILPRSLQQSAQVTVQVNNTSGVPQPNIFVHVFDGDTFMGISGQTDANGAVQFSLAAGNYRFRADPNGARFWSDTVNHCTVPGCTSASITITDPITVSVVDTDGTAQTGTTVWVYDGTTYLGKSKTTDANGDAVFTLDPGSYRFKTTVNNTDYYSGTTNHCTIPGCTNASITVNKPVTVTVQNTAGTPQVGVVVIAFNGSTNTGITGVTNANGQAALNLQAGSYRFRTTVDGTRFWSDTVNHCTVPGCDTAQITVSGPLPVTVRDSDGTPLVNLPVYAFNGSTYVNVSAITDANGQVFLTLVDGNYRFQTELNGVQFWSAETNHCTLPGCTGAEIEVTKPLTVSVTDTQGTAQAGLTVRIYDGETYTGYSGTTDVNGQVSLTLPAGNYRARVDYNEAKFYSSATNTCTLPGCEQISVTVNVPVTVSVVGVDNSPFEGITVELYKDGVLQTNDDLTDENGAVLFTLNDDVYQFAANLSETRFWSETCTIPGCTEQEIVLPGGQGGIQETIISYEYDDLYRLTEANYDNGLYFHYSYDAAGNRLTETTQNSSTSYVYDVGNRLSSVDGVAYTWDNNGNLLSDGASTYSYDYNNKLVGLSQGTDVYQYVYNGLGDRVQQIVNGVTTDYVLDINTGLTQVLQDGTNTYLYGVNRIAQSTTTETEYFLADALGSVRNLTDGIGNITLTQSYSPFGEVLTSTGEGQTDYAFTGEMFDPTTGLVYLRARYYGVNDGRFVSRDSWNGASVYPISYNKWGYSFDNPLVFFDPSGNKPTTRWPLANFTDTRHKIDSTNSIVQKFREERSWDWASMKRMHDDMWDVANAYADAYNRYVITHNRNLLNKYRPMIKHWEYLYASEKNCYGYINFVDFINPLVAFWKIHKGAMNIERVDGEAGTAWGESQSPNNIHIFDTLTSAKAAQTPRFIVHEIGHSFENAMADTTGRKEAYYPSDWPAVENRGQPFIQQNKWGRQGLSPFPELYNYRGDGVENFAGFHGKYLVWQFSKDIGGLVGNTDGRGEIFADMFIGWVYNKWEADPDFLSGLTYLGEQRKEYMDTQMDKWIFDIIQIRSGKVSVPYVENGRFVWKYQK